MPNSKVVKAMVCRTKTAKRIREFLAQAL